MEKKNGLVNGNWWKRDIVEDNKGTFRGREKERQRERESSRDRKT